MARSLSFRAVVAIALAAALAAVWFFFLKYEKVGQQDRFSGDAISQLQIRVQDVDLVLNESEDGFIHARLEGEKAKADRWTLRTGVAGDLLNIESEFTQKAYFNYKDRPKRELIVSLPRKTYESLRLSESTHWRDASFSILSSDGTRKTLNAEGLKEQGQLTTLFGVLRVTDWKIEN